MEPKHVIGSVISAFIIGAGSAFTVGLLFSHGTMNPEGLIGVCFAGAGVAAKDYRSLMKFPPLKNGGGDTELVSKAKE